jgi:hypothetical protein
MLYSFRLYCASICCTNVFDLFATLQCSWYIFCLIIAFCVDVGALSKHMQVLRNRSESILAIHHTFRHILSHVSVSTLYASYACPCLTCMAPTGYVFPSAEHVRPDRTMPSQFWPSLRTRRKAGCLLAGGFAHNPHTKQLLVRRHCDKGSLLQLG